MPLGPTLMHELNISPIQFAKLVSAYSLAAAITAIIYGVFANRYDRKFFLIMCFSLFIIGTLGCGLSSGYTQLLLARIFTGAFGGTINSVVFAMVSDLIPFERRGKAFGIIMSAFSVASVVGVPIGLMISNATNWHNTFYFIACFSALVCLTAVVIIPSIKEHIEKATIRKTIGQFKKILVNPHYQMAFSLVFLLNMSAFAIIPFLSPFAVKNVGLLETDLKYIYLVGGIFTIITARIIGITTDKLGPLKLFTLVSIFSCIPMYYYTSATPMPLAQFLVLSTSFMVLVSGRFIPGMTMITAIPDQRERGAFMGLVNSVQGFGSSLAALIAGSIISESITGKIVHFERVGYFSIIVTLICISVAFYLFHNIVRHRIVK